MLGLVAVLGLVIGSFLNVVVWRVPRGESVIQPPSACPTCHHPIRRRDNVPVLSWVALRGRCRDCGSTIPVRYPVVEAGTAVLFLLAGLRLGFTPALPAYLYLAAIGVALALIDLETHRLPNSIVLPSYPVLAVLLTAASWAEGDWAALLRACIGGAVLWLLYFLMVVVYPAGMGFGDVKLAGVLGAALAWLGWGSLVIGAFTAFLLGGIFAIGLVLAGHATRKTGIPFGPWMLLGCAVGVAFGEPVWNAYLTLLV